MVNKSLYVTAHARKTPRSLVAGSIDVDRSLDPEAKPALLQMMISKSLLIGFLLNFLLGFSCFAAESTEQQLNQAIQDPEYMLAHWIALPTAPQSNPAKPKHLTLREAILLALRYNPSIINSELDRITQRYQLRLAHNAYELQYALAGTALVEKSKYSGVGSTTKNSYLATPEVSLKTLTGSQLALTMDNNVAAVGNYNPLLNFSFTQPLLKGFGKQVNQVALLNAEDADRFNQLSLTQAVIDQITQVITTYRSLILSSNNLQNQRRQLDEAHAIFEINKKRIAAGQLESAGNIQQAYQIESLSLMVEQAENEFQTTAQELLQIIGLDPNMKLAVPDNVTLEHVSLPDLNTAIAIGLKHNTQYLGLITTLRADERAYAVAKDQQRWELNFTANAQMGTMNNVDSATPGLHNIYNGNNITETAGVVLKVPLHDLNQRNQLITAKIQLEKDRVNLIAAKTALITTIKNIMSTIQSQFKQYQLAERQLTLAAKSYELEKKKQHAGISSALDVNNTQNQLIQAQARLIAAKINYLNQISSLQRVLGTTLDEWHIKMRVRP